MGDTAITLQDFESEENLESTPAKPLFLSASLRSNRLSDHYMYEEFGAASQYSSYDLESPRECSNKENARLHDMTLTSLPRSTSLKVSKSTSLSRIPVFKDTMFHPRTNSINRKATQSLSEKPLPHQRTSPMGIHQGEDLEESDLVGTPHYESKGTVVFNADVSSSGWKDSDTLIGDPTALGYTDPTSIVKFNSLRLARTSHSRPLSADQGLSGDQNYHRDYREEQARRVQAINHAPTGQPPWLSEFQPDPRLPADQQVLPSVAKKIALQKWSIDTATTKQMPISNHSIDDSTAPRSLKLEDSNHDLVHDSSGVQMSSYTVQSKPDQDMHDLPLGQNPASKATKFPVRTPTQNFSRRRSQGKLASVHSTTQLRDSAEVAALPSVPSGEGRQSDSHLHPEEASHVDLKAEAVPAASPMTKSKEGQQNRPRSGFDFEEEPTRKKTTCCVVM